MTSTDANVSARGVGARVVGVVLLLFFVIALLGFYGCLHNSMHRSGDEGFYFTGMLVPIGLTALWLLWFGTVLVRRTPPGPMMKVPGAIALLALVSSLFMNIWRMGGYAEDRPFALVFVVLAIAVGCAGIGNMRDDGKSKSSSAFYLVAPIVFVAGVAAVLALNQTLRGS